MEPNNFEKNIQRKLDELKIPPSDSVWTNVEKKIAKKKKERRMIFVLIFLALFLFSGGYWLFNSVEHNTQLQNHQISKIEKKDSKPTNNPNSSFKQKSILSGNSTSEKNDSSNVPEGETNASLVVIQNKKSKNAFKKIQKNILPKDRIERKDRINSKSIDTGDYNKTNIDVGEENKTVYQNNLPGKSSVTDNTKEKGSYSGSEVVAKNKTIADTLLKNKKDEPIAKENSTLKKPSKDLQKNKWTFGITFAGGTSIIGEGPLGINNAVYPSALSTSWPGPVNNPIYLPSKIKGSAAFIGGIFIEKNISATNKISLGISYKYYSLLNKVGRRIDSLVTFPYQYLAVFGGMYNSTNNINTYRNNFHYLEIPLLVKLQLGKSKTVPLYWEAGITISQLINSNGLQFKSSPGLYYHDNSLFKKTQFGLQTGFSAILFSKTKNPLSIGPYFIYNTSKLGDEGLYSGKHFSFIGIRTEIFFGEK